MSEKLQEIAPGPTLRVAINLGNRALVQQEEGALRGITPALSERLAAEIGKPAEFVIYDGAGKTFRDAGKNRWDVGFLAIDAERARIVDFTRHYKEIIATFAVRDDSSAKSIEDVDTPGTRILVAAGSAYDLFLTDALKHAKLLRARDPEESFERFRDGEADAVGGVFENLERTFDEGSGIRILPGQITVVRQAMILPYHDAERIAALDAFLERAIADGFVQENS